MFSGVCSGVSWGGARRGISYLNSAETEASPLDGSLPGLEKPKADRRSNWRVCLREIMLGGGEEVSLEVGHFLQSIVSWQMLGHVYSNLRVIDGV